MTCSDPDCTAAVFSKGMCQKHYKREYMRAFMQAKRKKQPKRTERNKTAFLQALAAGASIPDACSAAGISVGMGYSWRKASPAFLAKWDAVAHRIAPVAAAEHQRAYRERQKAKARPQSTDNRSPERLMSDAALEAAIMRRGWQLTQMMRTPLCMWPADWLSNE